MPVPAEMPDLKGVDDTALKNKIINDVIFLKNAVAYTGNKKNQEIEPKDLMLVINNWGKEYDEANKRNNDRYAQNWRAENDWYVGEELPTYAQPLKHETNSIMGTGGYPSLKRTSMKFLWNWNR